MPRFCGISLSRKTARTKGAEKLNETERVTAARSRLEVADLMYGKTKGDVKRRSASDLTRSNKEMKRKEQKERRRSYHFQLVHPVIDLPPFFKNALYCFTSNQSL